mgnify:CR=1 FL=1
MLLGAAHNKSADRPLQGLPTYGKIPLVRAKSIPFHFRLTAKIPLHFFALPLPTATAALGCGGDPKKEACDMAFMMLGIGFALLPLLFRLALRLRLGIPLLYSVLMLTVFHGWYQTHAALGDGILFAMVGLAAMSWVVTLARKIVGVVSESLEEITAAKRLASRVRQARLSGSSAVNTEGLL